MSQIPAELYYSKSHEWVQENGDNTVTVGITAHAQELLGDLVFVELPEVGASLEAGEEFAVVESVKAASDVYSPISGEVVAVNEALVDNPEQVNEGPFADGWLIKVKLSDKSELDQLLNADAYQAVVETEV
ncbi:glycine cleavage system protein GcvH [Endozoicomonas sp. SM1973]|uniref:Glycine cleavage system H protein n=1 Tax=Spartinivicinus marinus TaxID=2994442 RepID=A0A853HZT4_9GAMM|nr:glycine cleavage system protein GcvH [Spartinivicinus marinus]MCX4029223.1 glycine cleavage system protein GcvH [Spartinivicinus marinus]NYZ65869.1 glycine cleavage system protein GcvH [Spartinivicinus marinus]